MVFLKVPANISVQRNNVHAHWCNGYLVPQAQRYFGKAFTRLSNICFDVELVT